ncbi:unnamed protein product [Commensalibacter communis]|uniref:hypothetical protein n=1 Tax=Commensalibacter communis TaxID=2972786 RepID=UPI0022FF92AA|nr:hypothetical protein [Commensalibacter communis]CAI3954872.1 unnamed protein product [Commensalibacter communis]
MEIIPTECFDLSPIEGEKLGYVYIDSQKTSLCLTGEKLEVCIKFDQYYVAFITYYSDVADESRRLAIYLVDQQYNLLDSKEIFGQAITYMFGENVDDRFYGLELREPNTILFDFMYTNQHQLTVHLHLAPKKCYLKLRQPRNFKRERVMKWTEYKVSGREGHQSVVINKLGNDTSPEPKITMQTPYYNHEFSVKSQIFLDGKYTHLTLDGTFLKNIIKIDKHYVFIIRTIVNNHCWDNLHLVSEDFKLLESVEIDREYDFIKIIIDMRSHQDNSFIIDYSGESKGLKSLIHRQLRCWVSEKKIFTALPLPRSLCCLRWGIYRQADSKSHFRFKKVKIYTEPLV